MLTNADRWWLMVTMVPHVPNVPSVQQAKYGPTTVERRSTCFNMTQDTGECNWAGPSWPYETSRVLTALANFLIDYPAAQAPSAGMTPMHYTKLLRTYARSMTTGSATNGSLPWSVSLSAVVNSHWQPSLTSAFA